VVATAPLLHTAIAALASTVVAVIPKALALQVGFDEGAGFDDGEDNLSIDVIQDEAAVAVPQESDIAQKVIVETVQSCQAAVLIPVGARQKCQSCGNFDNLVHQFWQRLYDPPRDSFAFSTASGSGHFFNLSFCSLYRAGMSGPK
jgi:hypothetical protein